jgi:transcriptional regulator with XRE-family HTH domain
LAAACGTISVAMSDAFIGYKIRVLREAKRLARLDVQRLTGISEATIARAERGGVVSRRTAERLAVVLGVPADDQLPGDHRRPGGAEIAR